MSTQALALLRRARERVGCGWPSFRHALALCAWGHAPELLRAADKLRAAWSRGERPPADGPWVEALAQALDWVDVAADMWGAAPATAPHMGPGDPPCAKELREWMSRARANVGLAFVDELAGELTREQVVCVLHLAVLLAEDALRRP